MSWIEVILVFIFGIFIGAAIITSRWKKFDPASYMAWMLGERNR